MDQGQEIKLMLRLSYSISIIIKSLSFAKVINNLNFKFQNYYNILIFEFLDEIPMVLCELNESALAYLNRD